MIFKYNNKIYETPNLEKKLKRMRLTLDDIEILNESIIKKVSNEDDKDNGITKHHFRLPNGYTITSIYDNLKYLNINDYEQID